MPRLMLPPLVRFVIDVLRKHLLLFLSFTLFKLLRGHIPQLCCELFESFTWSTFSRTRRFFLVSSR